MNNQKRKKITRELLEIETCLFDSVFHSFVKPLQASEYVIVLHRYVCEDSYGSIITQERSWVKY